MTGAPRPVHRDLTELVTALQAGEHPNVALHPPAGGRQAAVLILLGRGDSGGLEVVLVEKRPDLRKHAGQLAFPGGSVDDGDPDRQFTALRETEEEVGIVPDEVDVLGVLPPVALRATGFDVTAVVGWWLRPRPLVPVDVEELAAVHTVGIDELASPANRITWTHPAGFTGPGFVVGDLFVWGFTAALLDGLLALGGWTRPWDQSRALIVPPRFRSPAP